VNNWADPARPKRADSLPTISDVAVIGGGIVGACAALGAAQAGLSTIWVAGRSSNDAIPATERDLRVYALGLSTQHFLERLRVWRQLDASRIAPVFDMRVYGDRAGRSALHFDAYQATTERLATIVEHRELARVLDNATAHFPGIERIEGFASDVVTGPEHVSIDTERDARSARLVIAADGARSATREALGIGTRGSPYDQRALVGNFACSRPHGGTAFQWFTDEGVVALLPLAESPSHQAAVSLVWSAPSDMADRLMAESPDAIASRLSLLCSSKPESSIGPLSPLGPIVDVPLSLQWSTRMIAARAALVGDAAHVIHPLAGQGLNLGFSDVETLIDLLASRPSFRDCGDAVLLRRYERSRAGPVFAMRSMTDGLARLFASQRPGLAPLRELGMRSLDRLPPLKRLLMLQASGEGPNRRRE
jgi:ubiquinone biosynthesis UbiH/UbiF/VisC/COQ6 family hydroxylase